MASTWLGPRAGWTSPTFPRAGLTRLSPGQSLRPARLGPLPMAGYSSAVFSLTGGGISIDHTGRRASRPSAVPWGRASAASALGIPGWTWGRPIPCENGLGRNISPFPTAMGGWRRVVSWLPRVAAMSRISLGQGGSTPAPVLLGLESSTGRGRATEGSGSLEAGVRTSSDVPDAGRSVTSTSFGPPVSGRTVAMPSNCPAEATCPPNAKSPVQMIHWPATAAGRRFGAGWPARDGVAVLDCVLLSTARPDLGGRPSRLRPGLRPREVSAQCPLRRRRGYVG